VAYTNVAFLCLLLLSPACLDFELEMESILTRVSIGLR